MSKPYSSGRHVAGKFTRRSVPESFAALATARKGARDYAGAVDLFVQAAGAETDGKNAHGLLVQAATCASLARQFARASDIWVQAGDSLCMRMTAQALAAERSRRLQEAVRCFANAETCKPSPAANLRQVLAELCLQQEPAAPRTDSARLAVVLARSNDGAAITELAVEFDDVCQLLARALVLTLDVAPAPEVLAVPEAPEAPEAPAVPEAPEAPAQKPGCVIC